jgi:hypothetical protein
MKICLSILVICTFALFASGVSGDILKRSNKPLSDNIYMVGGLFVIATAVDLAVMAFIFIWD